MTRIDELLNYLERESVDGIFLNSVASLRYYAGYTGEDSILFVDKKHQILITDSRFSLQAQEEAPDWDIVSDIAEFGSKARGLGLFGKMAIEGASFSCALHYSLAARMPWLSWRSLNLTSLRQIKSPQEIELIERAVAISDKAFEQFLPQLHVGMKEYEAAALLEYNMRMLGSEKCAFPTIAASGIRSALPHGVASAKEIEAGDFVTFDFGAVYKGYCSDITRTVVMGTAATWQKEIYDIVFRANMLGENIVRPEITGRTVDAEVRRYITELGYGEYFCHGLGHGVGLEIHEEPRLSRFGESLLREGMVVTVEPGIYLPRQGGVRIEDTVTVTEDGCRKLTSANKQLLEIS